MEDWEASRGPAPDRLGPLDRWPGMVYNIYKCNRVGKAGCAFASGVSPSQKQASGRWEFEKKCNDTICSLIV